MKIVTSAMALMLIVLIALGFSNFDAGVVHAAPAETTLAAKPTSTETATVEATKTTSQEESNLTRPMSKNLSSLKIDDLKLGKGIAAEKGKKLTVHYTGWLKNGKKFDSSLDRGTPFSFSLGSAQVIKGWDQGLIGMKVGGKRKLTIPPQLGYGEAGAGEIIPSNSTLVFEVELLKVE